MLDVLTDESTLLAATLFAIVFILLLAWRSREVWLLALLVPLGWMGFYYTILFLDVQPYATDNAWREAVIRPALICFLLVLPFCLWQVLRRVTRRV